MKKERKKICQLFFLLSSPTANLDIVFCTATTACKKQLQLLCCVCIQLPFVVLFCHLSFFAQKDIRTSGPNLRVCNTQQDSHARIAWCANLHLHLTTHQVGPVRLFRYIANILAIHNRCSVRRRAWCANLHLNPTTRR